MQRSVWFSPAFIDSRLVFPFRNDVAEADENKMISIQKQIQSGKPVLPEDLPRLIWVDPDEGLTKPRLKDIFLGFGVCVVSARCADVMRRFDLGAGGLHPVGVCEADKITPLGKDWFCLAFGNVKDGILPALSPGLRPNGTRRLALRGLGDDIGISVNSAVLEGPDLWIDVNLFSGFFLSEKLATALKKNKCSSGFALKECVVID